ncbi:putative FabA-like domain protein [Desulfosarcina cetonica]|nr:putative FabA-like domain protein [Desulfosarcina cetonica]
MELRHMATQSVDLTAEARIPRDSAWFSGHFPGQPVLPGIAQLALVFDLIQAHAGHALRIVEMSRIRFKRMILPEDPVTIIATPKPGRSDVYTFRIEKIDGLVTTGTMTVAPSRT